MGRPEEKLSDNQQEGKRREHHQRPAGRLASLPPDDKPLMEKEGIETPGQKRPDLFGIPLPVASPDDPRPERTGQNAKRQQRKSPKQAEIIDPVQITERREEPDQAPSFFRRIRLSWSRYMMPAQEATANRASPVMESITWAVTKDPFRMADAPTPPPTPRKR